jgi:hypothetical protein
MPVKQEPQTELEEIRVTRESDPDGFQELMAVIPDLMTAKDELSEARKSHISDLQAAHDALVTTFRGIVARKGWGASETPDKVRIEGFQITAQQSTGHDVMPSTRATLKRVG